MSVNSGTINIGKSTGWERSDFPIICQTCLGDNPYVRMMRAEFDKECKICARPFTVFKWRPGRNARYKKTEVCQTCAKLKNVCQTCLLDLEFALPVQVRDITLPGLPGSMPLSDVGKEYQAEMMERQLANGTITYGRSEMKHQLQKIARNTPYYKRNQAHVCSFFLKGECNRGELCPYRHELPDTANSDPELANQNIKDRYHGVNDPVAKKILTRMNAHKITPPVDLEVKTLYIGNVQENITEQDLRDKLYSFGEIKEVRMVTKSLCAFVTYSTRESAEKAAENLFNNFVVNDITLRISWAKPQTFDGGIPTQPIPPQVQFQAAQPVTGGSNYFSLPTAVPSTYGLVAPPPPNPLLNKPLYPSMNPNRFGSKRDR